MQLVLQIVTDPAYGVSKQMLRVFSESGGTVGRALDSYWVIPDPKRHVSGTHFVVEYSAGAFWVRDLSRNGLFINGSKDPIGHGRRARVSDGDRLRLGRYQVAAHVRNRDHASSEQVGALLPVERLGPEPLVSVPVTTTAASGDEVGELGSTGEHAVAQPEAAADTPESTHTSPEVMQVASESTGEHPRVEADAQEAAAGVPESTTNSPEVPQFASESTGEHPRLETDVQEAAGGVTQVLDDSVVAAASGARVVAIDTHALRAAGLLPPSGEARLIANQFRHIKRGVIASALGRGGSVVPRGRLVMLTSSLPGEGKTFCAMNLAMSLAREKEIDVVLVDADVAKPKLSKLLGVADEPGLLHVLEDARLDINALVLPTDVVSLGILPAGRSSDDDATELLASERMRTLAEQLLAVSPNRVVVFDSPPLLLTNESRVLATAVGQVLLVVAAGVTPRQAVGEALGYLGDTVPVGLLLNQSKANRPGSYYGYGDYGYGGYG